MPTFTFVRNYGERVTKLMPPLIIVITNVIKKTKYLVKQNSHDGEIEETCEQFLSDFPMDDTNESPQFITYKTGVNPRKETNKILVDSGANAGIGDENMIHIGKVGIKGDCQSIRPRLINFAKAIITDFELTIGVSHNYEKCKNCSEDELVFWIPGMLILIG